MFSRLATSASSARSVSMRRSSSAFVPDASSSRTRGSPSGSTAAPTFVFIHSA